MIDTNTENINGFDEANEVNNNIEEVLINPDNSEEINEANNILLNEEPVELSEIEIESINTEIQKDENLVSETTKNNIIEETVKTDENTDDIVGIEELSDRELLNELSYLINETKVDENKKKIEKFFEQYKTNQKEKEKRVNKELQEQVGESAKLDKFIDPYNDELLELEKEYKNKKAEIFKEQEKIKQQNLEAKLEIIEKIKAIINVEGLSVNKSFIEFKELQNKWTEIGPVPAADSDTLWKSYQLQVSQFYKLLKLNYELRELDQKKNLAQKIELCEKAEELLLEPDFVAASAKFQELFAKWKEIGSVTADKRQEIWDRFREAGNKIRSNANEHFEALKEERNNNYKNKLAICEETENYIKTENPVTNKEWTAMTAKIVSLQKTFNSIGAVPNEHRNEIFERFRAVCNKFFEDKKEFYNTQNTEQNENLHKKIDLCVSAESLKDSTEWKKTTELFLNLQKKWKEIGPVPFKESEATWKRFRAACDFFFNAKSAYYSNIGAEHEENKIKKEELIKEIDSYTLLENQNENIEALKAFQARWSSIGYVARADQEKLYSQYKAAIDALYKKMKINSKSLEMSNFNERINNLTSQGNTNNFTQERKKILDNIRTIELEINKIENTKSYFSAGSSAEIMAGFDKKIQKCLDEITVLKEKKKMLDLAEKDFLKREKENE